MNRPPYRRAVLFALCLLLVAGLAPAATAQPGAVPRPHDDDRVVDVVEVEKGFTTQAAVRVPFASAYAADPMGIVAYRSITGLLASGAETWDVYVCTTDSLPSAGVVMADAVAELNDSTTGYFRTISEGRYRPAFRAAGVIDADVQDCGVNAVHEGLTPRIYVKDWTLADQGGLAGLGGPGIIGADGEALIYEGASRRVEVTADAVLATGYEFSPAGSISAHEIGHSIFWAHAGANADYDNALDLMSAGWTGTHAFNLYAAGWMRPEQVALHHGGDRTYSLGPVGYAGQRMIVLTTGVEGLFYILGVRTPDEPVLDEGAGASVQAPGVEVYRIDQRPSVCVDLPGGSPCVGLLASVSPHPAESALTYPYAHFHEAGSSFSIDGVPITVEAAAGGTLNVRVADGLTGRGVFLDDDDSVFESDIEWVAIAGITRGCNPPRGDFFCPRDTVTRGQMAAFLVRTLGLPAATTDHFTDDAGSVFEADINALAESGITRGCSDTGFCPNATVTREQMAAFLVRAYRLAAATTDHFTDDDGTTFEAEINALAESGITRGCSETSFCGRDTVTREQMAAFLKRAETR